MENNNEKTASLVDISTRDSGGWIEYAYDTGVRADYNYALWVVPSTYGPNPAAINYIFNAMQPSDSSSIIQPVLEWNRWPIGGLSWTCTAWYVENHVGICSTTHVPAAPGNVVIGTMTYQGNHKWNIKISKGSQYSQLNLQQTNFGPEDWFFGPNVFWTMEGYNILVDNDVPGHTYFYGIYLSRNGSRVSVNFKKVVHSDEFYQLHNLDVTWLGQTNVTLHTNNP